MKIRLALTLALLCHVGTSAAIAQTSPLSMQMDRHQEPSPICANKLASSSGCQQIGTMSNAGVFIPNLAGLSKAAGNVFLDTGSSLVSTPLTGAFTLSGAGVASLNPGSAFLAAIGTGSNPVSLQSYVAAQPVSAVLYGIVPGGSSDANTAQLQRAINDGVSRLVFSGGTYDFSATGLPIIDNRDGLILEGASPGGTVSGGTIFRIDTATADFIHFGDGSGFPNSLILRDITITPSQTMTAGIAIATNNTFGLTLDRVKIQNYCNGVDTYNAQSPVLTDVYIAGLCPTTGKGLTARGSGTGSNMYITRGAIVGPIDAEPQAGLYVENFDGIFATDWQANFTGHAIEFAPPAPASGQSPNFSHFFGKGLSLESNEGNALQVDGSGGYVFSVICVQCGIRSHANAGVFVAAGANVKGIRLVQAIVQDNGTVGLYFDSSLSDLQIVGGSIGGNNVSNGSFNNIQFGIGTFNNVQIVGNKIGPSDNLTDLEKYGIGVDVGSGSTAFNGLLIEGNDMLGNLTGPVDPNFLTSTFINRRITGNIGLVTETAGVATIGVGGGVVTVTHGLSITPTMGDLSITPNCDATGSAFWADTPTSTTFTIHTNSAQSAVCNFGWQAAIH